MVSFSIPTGSDFFTFKIGAGSVLFAGSRHGNVDSVKCQTLISAFGSLGFSFLTGCADGVDRSFRLALSESTYNDRVIVACAFRKRVDQFKGIFTLFVVPDTLPPKVALAKRTLWMTGRCSMLILFPSDPVGKGSSLAFNSAIMNNKPVFVVSDIRPKDSSLYTIYKSNLFGVVDGFWCIPPVYKDTGLCYEEV